MVAFNVFVKWYEDQCRLAIKKGNLPKDVTQDEAFEYMDFVFAGQSKPGVEHE